METTIQKSLVKVKSLFYHREMLKYNFDKFSHIQMGCYKMLHGVGYSNDKRVDNKTKVIKNGVGVLSLELYNSLTGS